MTCSTLNLCPITNHQSNPQALQFFSGAKFYHPDILAVHSFLKATSSPPALPDHNNSPVCENPIPFPTVAPTSRPLAMALEAETKAFVAKFDYTDEDVNKGVKEFLRQMGRPT
jgi:hypothetical protein